MHFSFSTSANDEEDLISVSLNFDDSDLVFHSQSNNKKEENMIIKIPKFKEKQILKKEEMISRTEKEIKEKEENGLRDIQADFAKIKLQRNQKTENNYS